MERDSKEGGGVGLLLLAPFWVSDPRAVFESSNRGDGNTRGTFRWKGQGELGN